MATYFKAVRPNGTDFYSGTIDYASALGGRVKAPSPAKRGGYSCCSDGVLHAADVPTETLIGGSWPCRLFEVTGRPVAQEGHKFGFRSLRVVREIEPWRALGPQGQGIAALLERARTLTPEEARSLAAAGDAAWDAARAAARDAARAAARAAAGAAAWAAARDAARDAAGDAARDAAGDAAWDAAWAAGDAAWALCVRDLISSSGFTQHHYGVLTRPWRTVVGPIHCDGEALV